MVVSCGREVKTKPWKPEVGRVKSEGRRDGRERVYAKASKHVRAC